MPKTYSSLRVLVTGGGTGGHIYPLISVAEELQNIGAEHGITVETHYVGAPGRFREILLEQGIRISEVFSSKWRRYVSLLNILDIPKFFVSIFQALFHVFWIMPDVLFSKGGPGSLPVVFACWFYRIPVLIHESDAVPGRANLWAARFATRIGISFLSSQEYFGDRNVALVGNPIRTFLLKDRDNQEFSKRYFGFAQDEPLLLVLGGSQGSTRINEFILNSLELLIRDFQILHQVGVKNFEEIKREGEFLMKDFPPEERSRYKPMAYFKEDIKDAFAAADLIVSRAGAGSIFEIAAFGKPSILIPLQEGADQRANAYEYAKTGAAVVLEEQNLLPNIFAAQLKKIFGAAQKRSDMSEAASQFARPSAARLIAEGLVELATNADGE